MTRTECEAKLMELMEKMVAVLHEYDPDSRRISASYTETGGVPHISICNDWPESCSPSLYCWKTGNDPLYSYHPTKSSECDEGIANNEA